MRKTALLLTILLVVCVFASCGTQPETEETTTVVETTQKSEDVIKINVLKTSLEDPDAFIQSMEAYDAEIVDMSANNSYILTFSKGKYQQLLDDKQKTLLDKFRGYEENPEHYIDSIEYDEDFRNVVFYVDRDLYNSNANSTSDMIVAAPILAYQIYLPTGQGTKIEVIFTGTEEVVSTFSLPMNISYLQ